MTAKELGNMAVSPIWEDDRMIDGITLRQQFAMAAMQGLIIACPSWYSHQIATNAVNLADELLDKLAKGMP